MSRIVTKVGMSLMCIFVVMNYVRSKMHPRSLNLLWCVIPVPKLTKCSSRSSNLLIVSCESQIYLNNLLN
jgi:hypothetical protein